MKNSNPQALLSSLNNCEADTQTHCRVISCCQSKAESTVASTFIKKYIEENV